MKVYLFPEMVHFYAPLRCRILRKYDFFPETVYLFPLDCLEIQRSLLAHQETAVLLR